ncbi:MAG: ATP-binding cassette domain-containing protein, partial [Planctomycetales bacterium]|nr:ATP-binding cassette domain-containing protein [Planctomycetales bacterium]
GVSFQVRVGELFVFLGPNGGGKTTLFRILSTLMPPRQGTVQIGGYALPEQVADVRGQLGVVFQSPSLDKQLTVHENLKYQAELYGLGRRLFREREQQLLEQLGLADRRRERTETLSGGLRRRVEIAKGLIHHPRVLLMDEPSTGLDPGARSDVWRYLQQLRDTMGITVLMTTHLLEEAEKADRIAILHQGEIVAIDTPAALRNSVGGDSISIETDEPARLARQIQEQFSVDARVVGEVVRLEQPDGPRWVPRLAEAFGSELRGIHVGRPTLEDVFIQRTGHRFWGDDESASEHEWLRQ